MNVGKRLLELKTERRLTQNGLAERAGVFQTHLRRVELGMADITIGHLQLLCDAMGISLQEFFDIKTTNNDFPVTISKLSPKQKTLLFAFIDSLF